MAPDQYVGLRHGSIYHTQHQRQIIVLQTYGKSSCLTGSLIRQTIERHKVETGLFDDLFAQPVEVLSDCVSHTWISSAWRYMRRFHLHVKESTASLLPRREGDAAIMARFIEAGNRGKQLAVLNRCRLYLRIVSLADILDGHGTSLLPGVLNGSISNPQERYIWPRQASPDRRSWRMWEETIIKALDLSASGSIAPDKRLGRWLRKDLAPPWRYEPDTGRLYRNEEEGWTVFTICGRRRRAGSRY